MAPYILVVESDPDLQKRLGDMLREANYEMAVEAEGAWAKRSLLVRPPQAVILNTALSDGAGFSVADELRKDDDTKEAPIFFLATRFRGAAHRTEARRRFAPAEYFTAPVDLDSLLAKLLVALPPREPIEPTRLIPDYPAAGRLADTAQRREKREVEAQAKQLHARHADLQGSLAREPFARLLRRIYLRRLSGALLLERDQIKKIVHFKEGYPVSVRSNALAECLGQILLADKLISERALEESLRRMKAEKKQQGQLLVEMGALSPYNLERALTVQAEAKLFEIFGWRNGTFSFTEGHNVPAEAPRLDRPPAALILEGIQRYYDQVRQEAVLGRFTGQYVGRDPDPLKRLQDITSDPAERRFVEAIDGSRRLETLLASAPIPLPRARLLLVAMSEAGMIEPHKSARRSAEHTRKTALTARMAEKEKAPVAPAPTHPLTETGVRRAAVHSREDLLAVLEAMDAQSHFEALGVSEGATPAEVDHAYEVQARQYHPDQFRGRPAEVRAVALRIFERLGEAQATLRDANRRRRYVAKLARDRAGAVPPTGPAIAPPAAEKVYYAGVEHLRARRYQDAVQAFQRAVALAPQQASYRGALGWALFRESPADPDAVEAGLEQLRRAVDLDAQDPWVRISLGRFYAETGWPELAITEFEHALRLNPGLSDVEEEIRRLRERA